MKSRIILTAIVGLVIGLMAVFLERNGYLQQWRLLPAPPARVAKLASFSSRQLILSNFYIETVDNKVYTYFCNGTGNCWEQTELPKERSSTPCDYSLPAFAFTANPPQNVTGCLQSAYSYDDGSVGVAAYSLDSESGIWQWNHTNFTGVGAFLDDVWRIGRVTLLATLVGFLWDWLSQKRSGHLAAIQSPAKNEE